MQDRTALFYAWEQRGRGWLVWNNVVSIEPPFLPFKHPQDIGIQQRNTNQNNLSFLDQLKQYAHPKPPSPSAYTKLDCQLELQFGKDNQLDIQALQTFISQTGTKYPLSFEIIGSSKATIVQLVCENQDKENVIRLIQKYLPECDIKESNQTLEKLWNNYSQTLLLELSLAEESMRPIQMLSESRPYPDSILEVFRDTANDELSMLQVIYTPVGIGWNKSMMRSVSDGQGGSFFMGDPKMVSFTELKTSFPLFACVIRIIIQSETRAAAEAKANDILKAVSRNTDSLSNQLEIAAKGYIDGVPELCNDILHRTSHRSGILLNTKELLSLIYPAIPYQEKAIHKEIELTIDKTISLLPPVLPKKEIDTESVVDEIYEREVKYQEQVKHRSILKKIKKIATANDFTYTLHESDTELIPPYIELVKKEARLIIVPVKESIEAFNLDFFKKLIESDIQILLIPINVDQTANLETIPKNHRGSCKIIHIDKLSSYLFSLFVEPPKETTIINGYKVKVTTSSTKVRPGYKEDEISKIIANAIARRSKSPS